MIFWIEDDTLMYCPKCGDIMRAEDADTKYYPATWGYDGGSPEEYEWNCPKCGEELYVVENFCEICGEPLVKNFDGYYESCGKLCDECDSIISDCLDEFIQNVASELGVDHKKATEAILDYWEQHDWEDPIKDSEGETASEICLQTP
jgi:predicted RNA-binding Zn-ribbon protein involved in translation (DUF1610 family)